MRPQDFLLLANAAEEVADVLEKLVTEHPDVFNSLGIRYPLMDELSGYSGMLRDHVSTAQAPRPAEPPKLTELQQDAGNLLSALGDAWPYIWPHVQGAGHIPPKLTDMYNLIQKHGEFAADPYSNQPVAQQRQMYEQAKLAEQAFMGYEFGDGVMVTDTDDWSYRNPGHERTRKVYVKGEASDAEDEDAPGAYLVRLNLSLPVSALGGVPHTFNEADHAEMATAVLNEFHAKQGISVLDDFEISVHLFGGDTIEETEGERDTGLVLNADFCGKVDESDLPFELPKADGQEIQPHPSA